METDDRIPTAAQLARRAHRTNANANPPSSADQLLSAAALVSTLEAIRAELEAVRIALQTRR